MIWFVYILELNNWQYYTWSTSNIENRVKYHENWKVKSTRYKRPIKLLYFREYWSIDDAKIVESWLKRMKSKKIINDYINWMVFNSSRLERSD